MRNKKIILISVTLSIVFSMSKIKDQADNDYKPGYTIEKNTDFPNSDADYQVTFLYEDKDAVYIFMSPNDISKLEQDLIEKLNV